MGIYIYFKNLADGITSRKCELIRKDVPRASVKLDELDNFVEQVIDHKPHSSVTKCETTKVEANIKRTACDSFENPKEIVIAKVQNVSEAVAVNLPSLNHLGRNIRSQRYNRHCHLNPII